MSCLHCNSKFGFFNKEAGCGNCGLSLCQKCLKHKYKLPSNGNEVRICISCFKKLTVKDDKSNNDARPPPDIFFKRLAAIQNPSTSLQYKNSDEINNLKTGLEPEDLKILDRLEKLRNDKEKPTPPSTDQLRSRLDNLKGETSKTPIVYDPKAVDLRSDQEKIDSLLDEFASEVNIKDQYNPSKDLEERVAKLKGEKFIKEKQQPDESSGESEEESERIVEKVIKEVALDEKGKKTLKKDDLVKFEEELEESEPELPWCILCNNDAKFKCLDCNDLYCARCCKEIHKEWGNDDHEIIKFKKKAK